MIKKPHDEIFLIESNLSWLNYLPERIQSVYWGKFYHFGVFNELYNKYSRRFFRRKLLSTKPVGVWGWNTWCGVHVLPLLTRGTFSEALTRTIDVGFNRLEPGTGLLPHAIVHKNDIFGSEPTYRCYGGEHGEAYNLDNMMCWAKMAMEYFLVTNDSTWFTHEKFKIICHTLDFILDSARNKFNPFLVFGGIEGDWTECTEWELDNSNINVNLLNALQLLIEVQKCTGYKSPKNDYSLEYAKIFGEFIKPYSEGGFWDGKQGYFIHGNDGKGDTIHGDKYFESTVNYFSLLWGIGNETQHQMINQYLDNKHSQIETPYPVLTNYLPRTGARRKNYGETVTNGDVWMVLGAHAAAARLLHGNSGVATEMYRTIVEYETKHGTLHNCIYQHGRVNDTWSPEIANYGALYAPLVLGILGLQLKGEGLEFHLHPLKDMNYLKIRIYPYGIPLFLTMNRIDNEKINVHIEQLLDLSNEQKTELLYQGNCSNLLLTRKKPMEIFELN
jgi:hypothetical protein